MNRVDVLILGILREYDMSQTFEDVKTSNAYRLLHPKIVALLISVNHAGAVNGMPAAWVTPLSRNPPLVGASIAPTRYTYGFLKDSGEFTLNIISKDYVRTINFLGTVSGRDRDKLRECGLTLRPSRRVRAPHVLEALAVLECTVYKEVEAGDHVLIMGRVVEAYVKQGIFEEVYNPRRAKMLMHLGSSSYTTIVDDVLSP